MKFLWCTLVQALQHYKPPEPAAKPLTWDQHLLASIAAANKTSGGRAWALWAALEAFVAAKVSGGLQKTPPRCSDLVWAGLGMATAFMILGVLAAAAKALPVVGQWHQQVCSLQDFVTGHCKHSMTKLHNRYSGQLSE